MDIQKWMNQFKEEFWKITPHSQKGRESLEDKVAEEALEYMHLEPKEAAITLHNAKYCKGSSLKHEDNCWCFPF